MTTIPPDQPGIALEDDIASFSATDSAKTPVGKRILASLQRLQRITVLANQPLTVDDIPDRLDQISDLLRGKP